MLRLLLDRNRLAVVVKFHDTKTLRIIYIVAEYGGAFPFFCILYRRFQTLFQTVAGKDIVAQHHGHTVISDELLANDEGLGQSVGAWLYCIGKIHAKLMAVPQKFLEPGRILRGRNDEDVADPCVHQY